MKSLGLLPSHGNIFLPKKLVSRRRAMNPKHLQGILCLADLQDDFAVLDYKKFKDQKRVELILKRLHRTGLCSGCGKTCADIHSIDWFWLRDLSAFGYQVELKLERFTFKCGDCKGYRVETHWLYRPRRAFSWRYEKQISKLCEEMTNASVGRLEDLHDKSVYSIDFELLELRLGHQKLPETIGPHYSMDEVYFRYYPDWHAEADKKYITNLLDLTHCKILANSPGRGEKAAESCLLWLTQTQRRQAKSVATDLHQPFHKAIRMNCPNADIVLDRFHIMQLFNEAMNDFRKEQMILYSGSEQIELLKGRNKWLLMTREEKLSKTDRTLLAELKSMNDRIVDALLIREYLTKFFQSPTLRLAKLQWYRTLKMVKLIDIKAFNEFFRRLTDWAALLWNYFIHRTSSGVIEAINHKIKVVKSSAYGYKNLRYFQLKVLQRCGFLNTQFAPLPKIHKPRRLQVGFHRKPVLN
jgi:transposase